MDNDFSPDLGEIVHTIRSSDVVAMRFVIVSQRLLLDFRSTELDGPMVRLVDPVKSIEERFRSLKKLRPRFQAPPKITAVWWPRFVSSLVESGVWDVVMERVSEAGNVESVRMATATLDELVAMERQQKANAISGEGFRTLWSASPSRR